MSLKIFSFPLIYCFLFNLSVQRYGNNFLLQSKCNQNIHINRINCYIKSILSRFEKIKRRKKKSILRFRKLKRRFSKTNLEFVKTLQIRIKFLPLPKTLKRKKRTTETKI